MYKATDIQSVHRQIDILSVVLKFHTGRQLEKNVYGVDNNKKFEKH